MSAKQSYHFSALFVFCLVILAVECLFGGLNLVEVRVAPLANLGVGDKLQLDGQAFVKTGHSNLLMLSSTLTCPRGQRIAGQWVKCFTCPTDATYDSVNVTCNCTFSDQVYDWATNTCTLEGMPPDADTTNCVLPVGYMDSWNGCSSLATHATVCLADPRDYRTYRVRKLADGNCWMVDSLKFGGNYGDTDGCSANSGVGNFGSGGSSNSTKAQETFATGYYGHCRSIPGTYSDDYYNDTRAYNNYLYDWVAAMQSTLAYVGSTTTFTSPQQGICPSGWHLPEADIVSSSGEYYSLLIAYCGSTVNCQTSDLQGTTKGNFTLAGAANGSTGNLESQGEYGGFWSSSADPDWYGIAYGFWAQSDYVGADWDPLKSTGGSVRCIKD